MRLPLTALTSLSWQIPGALTDAPARHPANRQLASVGRREKSLNQRIGKLTGPAFWSRRFKEGPIIGTGDFRPIHIVIRYA
jgi:hypothetical protein